MFPQQANPVKLHAMLVPIKHHPVKHPVMLLKLATMFLAQPKPAKRHVAQVPIKHIQVKHPVMLLMQATMFLAQPKRHKRLVLLERTAILQSRSRVQTLLQGTTCHLLASRVQPYAMLVPIKHYPVKHPVMLLMLATMFRA